MGLGRVDKLQSFTRACIKPTQGGQCVVGTLLVLGRATGNTDTQDSPQPGLGGSHHLPPYSILYTSPWGPHPNGFVSRDSRLRVPKSPKLGLPQLWSPTTLEPHNFVKRPWIEMQSKAKLQPSLRAFQQYVARPIQTSKSGRFLTFSCKESNWQFDSRPFFRP